eukprot:55000-Eustigmatos_ZCMA.PRE.1
MMPGAGTARPAIPVPHLLTAQRSILTGPPLLLFFRRPFPNHSVCAPTPKEMSTPHTADEIRQVDNTTDMEGITSTYSGGPSAGLTVTDGVGDIGLSDSKA